MNPNESFDARLARVAEAVVLENDGWRECCGGTVAIPEHLICSLTGDLFIDPCIAADGVTYERSAIALLLDYRRPSPITGRPMKHSGLEANVDLRAEVIEFRRQCVNDYLRASGYSQ